MKKVEVSIEIKTDPARIISAFIESEMLKEWWNVERTLIEKKAQGLYILTWNIGDHGFGFVSTGIIKEYDPESLVVIEKFVYLNPDKSLLGPMVLTIRANRKNGFTELYICQEGYQDGKDWEWYYEAVRDAWPVVARNLKNYLERNQTAPLL